jgi:predicted N-formylglutamate amidohydrolase
MKTGKPLLQKGEPPPFLILNKAGKGPGVIVCDHAARRIPKALQKTFGVSKKHMGLHFACDIGAQDLSAALAKKLGLPAVIATYSRLVLDLNRSLKHPWLMTEESDPFPEGKTYKRISIPGNLGLSKAEKQARINALFWPYHDAVTAELRRALKRRKKPWLISVHSFTPDMDGTPRPWEVGVLWDEDEKTGRALIASLRKAGIIVGDNQPYSMKGSRLKGGTMSRHGKGIPHTLVEVRNDLLRTRMDVEKWANILALALKPLLEEIPSLQGRNKI